jgi:glycosyltransferase involved in cell wall biosynthesis
VVPSELPPESAPGTLRIGFAGRLDQPQKRIHDVIAVGTRLKKTDVAFELRIAGDGPERSSVEAEVKAQCLEDNISLLGSVAPNKMGETLYGHVNAMVVTSSWETGPIVAWESMALGIPLVTSRYMGSRLEGLLRDGENCLMFEVGDVEGAAAQLKRLAHERALRESLRGAAFETASRSLSHAASLDQWEHALRDIASRSPVQASSLGFDPHPVSGRLDRLVGFRVAQCVRRCCGIRSPASGPEGEWPHTLGGQSMPEEEFFALAGKLDDGAAVSPVG